MPVTIRCHGDVAVSHHLHHNAIGDTGSEQEAREVVAQAVEMMKAQTCPGSHLGEVRPTRSTMDDNMVVALAEQTLPGCVRHERIEEFTEPPGSMDLVVSRLALHYVSDAGAVLRRVYATLAHSWTAGVER